VIEQTRQHFEMAILSLMANEPDRGAFYLEWAARQIRSAVKRLEDKEARAKRAEREEHKRQVEREKIEREERRLARERERARKRLGLGVLTVVAEHG
jgi:hypothetical protein